VTQVERSGAAQRLTGFDLEREDKVVSVQIPDNIQAIRKSNLALAREWRLGTRQIFEAYFARGFVAVDFIAEHDDAMRHNYYVLSMF
jgi:predicted GNAT superfamily acetyltransferase